MLDNGEYVIIGAVSSINVPINSSAPISPLEVLRVSPSKSIDNADLHGCAGQQGCQLTDYARK
jgi:hypothetical protein